MEFVPELFKFLIEILPKVGLESIGWSIRRLYCPVGSDALVLEVGSGGNPYFRSNVLLDAYETSRERHWVPIVKDRPTVFGFVERLPFADQSFDFIIASHVLEHSSDPAQFLTELQRVGKAGYIEVPDAFMERLNPYRDHRLEILLKDEALLIRKKASWCVDEELQLLYAPRVKRYMTGELMQKRPFAFHVRYYWCGKIQYVVENPDVDANWPAPADGSEPRLHHRFGAMKAAFLSMFRKIFSQRKRNRQIDLIKLLRCTKCLSPIERRAGMVLQCTSCQVYYPVRDGVPDMTQPLSSPT